MGIFLLAYPDPMIYFLKLESSNDIVIRILGMLLVFYGYFYVRSSRDAKKYRNFYMWTVHTRSAAIVFLGSFVLLKLASPIIIAFGAVELLGALWTFLELKRTSR